MENRRSIFGPLFLMAAGIVWLFIKSGSISPANLWALTHIWPYLLIAAGAGLILSSYWKYAKILLDIIVVGGAVFAIFNAPQLGWDNPAMFSMIGDGDFFVGPSRPGSGNVVTETREVSDFTSIKVDYPAQVFITQGAAPSVKIEAEDNLLPQLQTQVRNGTLEIFYKRNNGERVNPTKFVRINIVVKDLNEIDFDSAGELTVDGIETDGLDISISGAGNLKLNDVKTKNLQVDLSGAGNMSASGIADDFGLSISGFGSFNGKELHTQVADINLSGAGSATIWVDDELDAQISGAGSINYYGSPTVSKNVSGVGSVSKSGDK